MITNAGVYRAKGFADWGIGETTNGFPQFIARLIAEEYYDPEIEQWVTGDNEDITAYLVLIDGQSRGTLNLKQILAVTQYNGQSLAGLGAMDLSNTGVQFRIEPHIYDGKETLQVKWLDLYDATPGRTIKKLEGDALKKLDTKYSSVLKQMQGSAKPVKAAENPILDDPAVPKKRGRPSGKPAPKVENIPTQTLPQAAMPKAPPNVTEQALPKAAMPKAPPKAIMPKATCTKDEAWGMCVDLKGGNVTDDMLAEAWLAAIDAVAPGTEDEAITDEQWSEIKEAVMETTAVF